MSVGIISDDGVGLGIFKHKSVGTDDRIGWYKL